MELTAIILAGGKSSRMGQDKGLVNYNGKSMVEYSIEACKKITSSLIISTNNEDYASFGFPLIKDSYPNAGPMGGLEAALEYSNTEDNIVCPCDMPNIHPYLFELVLQKKSGKQAVVVTDKKGKVFPVFGYYNKSALPVIRQQIKTGNLKMLSLLKLLDAETVVSYYDDVLSNINYRKDLE